MIFTFESQTVVIPKFFILYHISTKSDIFAYHEKSEWQWYSNWYSLTNVLANGMISNKAAYVSNNATYLNLFRHILFVKK